MIENIKTNIQETGVEKILQKLQKELSPHAELVHGGKIGPIISGIEHSGIYFVDNKLLLVENPNKGGLMITACMPYSQKDAQIVEEKLEKMENKYNSNIEYIVAA